MSEQELKQKVRRLFRCGCRLSVFDGGAKVFVILRRRRSTHADQAEHGTVWIETLADGTQRERHFHYFMEQVVANGRWCAGAWESAREYHQIGGRRPGEIEKPRKTPMKAVKES